jgi:DNA-directed RNA polymerase subunit RPC12/RpoP
MSSEEKPIANLYWHLYVDCPKCGDSNDLADYEHDAENEIAGCIFNNEWQKLQGWEVTCAHCQHEFEIEKVEY